jgi:hypothetical protein
MGEFGEKWRWGLRRVWMVVLNFLIALVFVSAQRDLRLNLSSFNGTEGPPESDYILRAVNFLWQPDKSGYQHVWPVFPFFTSLFHDFNPIKVLFNFLTCFFTIKIPSIVVIKKRFLLY